VKTGGVRGYLSPTARTKQISSANELQVAVKRLCLQKTNKMINKSNIGVISITLCKPLFLLLRLSSLRHQCSGFENCTLPVRRNCVGGNIHVCVCVCVCVYIFNSNKSSIFIVPLNTAAVTGILLAA